MDGGVLAQWLATILLAVGLIYTIRHNSRGSDERDSKLKTELSMEIKSIKERLDDPQDGLSTIKREISAMKERCATVTSGFAERIKRTERDIDKVIESKQRSKEEA